MSLTSATSANWITHDAIRFVDSPTPGAPDVE